MSSESVCRLCLATDTPVRAIADTPLQEVYEKLTNVSLNSSVKPVVACCLCHWQLRKSHQLMTRAVRVDELLSDILQAGALVRREIISMVDRTSHKLDYNLNISPMETIMFIEPKCSIKEEKIKDEPFSFRNEEQLENEQMTCTDNVKIEDPDDMVLEESEQRTHYKENIMLENFEDASVDAAGLEDVVDVKTEKLSDEDVMYDEIVDIDYKINIEEMKIEAIDHKSGEQVKGAVPVTHGLQQSPAGTGGNIRHYNHTTTHDTDGEEDCSHINVVNEYMTQEYICDVCGDIFSRKYLLIRHIARHNTAKNNKQAKESEKPYKCTVCNKIFKLRCFIVSHMKTHAAVDTECAVCHKQFNHRGHLNQHLRTHTKEKPFKCAKCQKEFYRRNDLNVHLRTHSRKKPFECLICRKRFNHRGHLNQHSRTHSGEKPFECAICQKRFSRQSHVNSHLRTHYGEKPFECVICQERFNKQSHLNNHLRTHSAEKHFACDVCSRRFYRQSDLTAHLKIHSGKSK